MEGGPICRLEILEVPWEEGLDSMMKGLFELDTMGKKSGIYINDLSGGEGGRLFINYQTLYDKTI
jgi:hypothetical protein